MSSPPTPRDGEDPFDAWHRAVHGLSLDDVVGLPLADDAMDDLPEFHDEVPELQVPAEEAPATPALNELAKVPGQPRLYCGQGDAVVGGMGDGSPR